jgi:hypothetical protein
MALNLRIDGWIDDETIGITKYGYEAFGDNPDAHRWRAWWGSPVSDNWMDGRGIHLACYPVVKKTRAGAWVAHHAYWNGSGWKNTTAAKLVMDGSGSAWAKPTQEHAIRSIAIRLERWATRERQAIYLLKSSIVTLRKLRPDMTSYVEGLDDLFTAVFP